MLTGYEVAGEGLRRLPADADIGSAIWLDLFRPSEAEVARVTGLGLVVPTLAEMEEIEISNRLYREAHAEVMTVVLPGQSLTLAAMAGPVSFILTAERLISVRHHAPRPFETFAARAQGSTLGCKTPERLFVGLAEEIIARLADLLEATGRSLDTVAREIYGGSASLRAQVLERALEEIGRQGELLGRVRLGLLSMERALSYFEVNMGKRRDAKVLAETVKALLRDIEALEVHADFLGSRVALITDATLGMVNLAQNSAVKGLSVVAAIFLPPTLIASVYGMNFSYMRGLDSPWGYPVALVGMIVSAALTYAFFRWKRWL